MAFTFKMPQIEPKSKEGMALAASAAVVGSVVVVQLCTDWNPMGRCVTFLKQLRGHVSER